MSDEICKIWVESLEFMYSYWEAGGATYPFKLYFIELCILSDTWLKDQQKGGFLACKSVRMDGNKSWYFFPEPFRNSVTIPALFPEMTD